ncbi:Hint domain-containing protein [Litoreibacter arenae]|uniref:Type I secretion target repeat protein n=1 Tax=Litoreibacter arenae DSM 19593 TaxID=1123360 RepID=S9RUT9_9RHOB|nr:Hint domain-containing protein [Litoreibacter arenae]EPX77704.1 type I secretion target repeat protein [Litoreibacter arenae DSM 19593]
MTTLTNIGTTRLPAQKEAATVRLSPAGLSVGTPVTTSAGECCVEDLKSGDRVLTKDLGMQTIKCIAFRDVDLIAAPQKSPIHIPSGTFGADRPGADLYLAPTQRIALKHPMFDSMFLAREVLIQARDLLYLAGVRQIEGLRGITYVSLGFLQNHLLYCGNMAVDLGPARNPGNRPVLCGEEARLACSLVRPQVPTMHQAAGFPLH